MRVSKAFVATILISGCATPAAAELITDNIFVQLLLADRYPQPPPACYNREWTPKATAVAQLKPAADATLQSYLKIAASGGDISPTFIGRKIWRDWRLDGIPGSSRLNLTRIRDPWAGKVAKVDQTSFTVGNSSGLARSIWNAYAADGTLLGTYDALLRRNNSGARLQWLYLYSPGTTAKPNPIGAFCLEPGDIERWHAVQAVIEKEEAAKRAAKEARRAKR